MSSMNKLCSKQDVCPVLVSSTIKSTMVSQSMSIEKKQNPATMDSTKDKLCNSQDVCLDTTVDNTDKFIMVSSSMSKKNKKQNATMILTVNELCNSLDVCLGKTVSDTDKFTTDSQTVSFEKEQKVRNNPRKFLSKGKIDNPNESMFVRPSDMIDEDTEIRTPDLGLFGNEKPERVENEKIIELDEAISRLKVTLGKARTAFSNNNDKKKKQSNRQLIHLMADTESEIRKKELQLLVVERSIRADEIMNSDEFNKREFNDRPSKKFIRELKHDPIYSRNKDSTDGLRTNLTIKAKTPISRMRLSREAYDNLNKFKEHSLEKNREERKVKSQQRTYADRDFRVDARLKNVKMKGIVAIREVSLVEVVIDINLSVYNILISNCDYKLAFHLRFKDYYVEIFNSVFSKDVGLLVEERMRMVKQYPSLIRLAVKEQVFYVMFYTQDPSLRKILYNLLNLSLQDATYINFINLLCPSLKFTVDNRHVAKTFAFKVSENKIRREIKNEFDAVFRMIKSKAGFDTEENRKISQDFRNCDALYYSLKKENFNGRVVVTRDKIMLFCFVKESIYNTVVLSMAVSDGMVGPYPHILEKQNEFEEIQLASDSSDDEIIEPDSRTFIEKQLPSAMKVVTKMDSTLDDVKGLVQEAKETMGECKSFFGGVSESFSKTFHRFTDVSEMDENNVRIFVNRVIENPALLAHMLITFDYTCPYKLVIWATAFFQQYCPRILKNAVALCNVFSTAVVSMEFDYVEKHAVSDIINLKSLIAIMAMIMLPLASIGSDSFSMAKLFANAKQFSLSLVLADRSYSVISKIVDWLLINLGVIADPSSIPDTLTVLSQRLDGLKSRFVDAKLDFVTHPDNISESTQVLRQITSAYTSYRENKLVQNSAHTSFYGFLMKSATDFRDAIKSVVALNTARRQAVVVRVWGAAGSGKSYLTNRISSHFAALRGWNSGVIALTSTFFDNWMDQQIAIIDDIFNDTERKGEANLVQMISCVPWVVPKAAIEDKGMLFNPSLILTSSNCQIPNKVGVVDEVALFRRFNLLIEFVNKGVDQNNTFESSFNDIELYLSPKFRGMTDVLSYSIDGLKLIPQKTKVKVSFTAIVTWIELAMEKFDLQYKEELLAIENRMNMKKQMFGFLDAYSNADYSNTKQDYGNMVDGCVTYSFYGEPGVGKTFMVNKFLNTMDLRVLRLKGSELEDAPRVLQTLSEMRPQVFYVDELMTRERERCKKRCDFILDYCDRFKGYGVNVVFYTMNRTTYVDMDDGVNRRFGEMFHVKKKDCYVSNFSGKTCSATELNNFMIKTVMNDRIPKVSFTTKPLRRDKSYYWFTIDTIKKLDNPNLNRVNKMFAALALTCETDFYIPNNGSLSDLAFMKQIFVPGMWQGDVQKTIREGASRMDFSSLPDGEWKFAVGQNENECVIFKRQGDKVQITLHDTNFEVIIADGGIQIGPIFRTYKEWLMIRDNGDDIFRGLTESSANIVKCRLSFADYQIPLQERMLMTLYPYWSRFKSMFTHKYVIIGVVGALAVMSGKAIGDAVMDYFRESKCVKSKVTTGDGVMNVVCNEIPMEGDYTFINGKKIVFTNEAVKACETLQLDTDEFDNSVENGTMCLQSFSDKKREVQRQYRTAPIKKQSEYVNSGVVRMVQKNQCSIVYKKGGDFVHVCYALGIRDKTFITVGHLSQYETYYIKKNCKYYECKLEKKLEDRDLALYVVIDITFESFVDIGAHFLSDGNVKNVKDFFGFIYSRRNGAVDFGEQTIFNQSGSFFPEYCKELNVYRVRALSLERGSFERGDCGLAYFTYSQGKVMVCGIHQAVAGPNPFATVVSRELLTDYVKQALVDELPIFYPYSKLNEIRDVSDPPDFGNFEILGKVPKLFQSSKTHMVRMDTYNQVYESGMLPSVLSKEMLFSRISGYGRRTRPFPQEILDEVIDEMFDFYVPYSEEFRVLDDYECLNGLDHLSKLDLQTSLGYPWNTEPLTDKGKQDVFENIDGCIVWRNTGIAKRVKSYCNEMIEYAREGDRLMSIAMFTLKDETRTIEKVLIKPKTRLFQACPIELTYFARKVFGSMINFQVGNLHLTPSKVGIDVNSFDWDVMFYDAATRGIEGFDGDFSDFDSCQKPEIMRAIFLLYKRLCTAAGWTLDDLNMIDVLEANIVETILVADTYLLKKRLGNPSGWAGTTIFNDFANQVMMLMVWKILCKENGKIRRSLSDFTEFNYLATFGDDNFVIPDLNTPWYNHKNTSEVFSRYEIKYTMSDKLVESSSLNKPLEDGISFLKRRFIRRNGVTIAPLEISSILERFNWCSSGLLRVDISSHLNELFMDLSLHDEYSYELVRKIFVAYLSEYPNFTKYRPITYERMYNTFLARKFETSGFGFEERGSESVAFIEDDDYRICFSNSFVSEKAVVNPSIYHINHSSYKNYVGSVIENDISTGLKIRKNDKKQINDKMDSITIINEIAGAFASNVLEHYNNHANECECEECYGCEPLQKQFNEKDKGDENINAGPNRVEIADMVKTSLAAPSRELSMMMRKPLVPEGELTERFNFVQTVNYSVTNVTGQILYQVPLVPSSFPGTHLEYLSKLFLFYSGSFEFHLSLVSTDYHAGKLMFVHIPDPNFVPGEYSLQFYSQYAMQIVDVRENQSVEIAIPYESTQKALFMNSTVRELQSPGFFLIIVYSPLNAPDTVSQYVPINIMVRPTPGCHFLSVKNVPSAVIGGLPASSSEVLSSLLAPTPLYAPVEALTQNLCTTPSGGTIGAYDYLNAITPTTHTAILNYWITAMRGAFTFGAAYAQAPTAPLFLEDGTIIAAPCDDSIINFNSGLINTAGVSVRMGVLVPAVTNTFSTYTQVEAAVTATTPMVISTTGIVALYCGVIDRRVLVMNASVQIVTILGNVTQLVTTSLMTAWTNNDTGVLYVRLTPTSVFPPATDMTVTVLNERTTPMAPVNQIDFSARYGTYITQLNYLTGLLTAKPNALVLCYSKMAIPKDYSSTNSLFYRSFQYVTGAFTDLLEISAYNRAVNWGEVFYFVIKGLVFVGEIIVENVFPLLVPILRSSDPLVWNLRTIGTIKYELYAPAKSRANTEAIAAMYNAMPAIYALSAAQSAEALSYTLPDFN